MKSNVERIVAGILIFTFGALALFFGLKYSEVKKEANTVSTEKLQVTQQYNELNSEFETLKLEFDEIENSKYELTGELETKRQELIEQKDEVSRLLRKDRLSRTELNRARTMIDELKNEKNALLTQLKDLGEENLALKVENDNYSKTLTSVYQEKETLVARQDSLVEETNQLVVAKQELEEKQQEDAPKVEFAQVVPVRAINAGGVRYKNSGKERETDNNTRVDKLKINFTVEKNPVAEIGAKEYVVRVIGPDGLVIYDRERGSGEFTSNAGEGMKYTTSTNVDYDGNEKNVSLFWRQDSEYQEGVYTVQVFNRGFEVGSSTFELD